MSLSENIKLLRKTFGLTQSEFAHKVNKTMRTVQVWESGAGEPNRNNIKDIVNAFNVNAEWLLTGEGGMFLPAPADHGDRLFLDAKLLTEIIISAETALKRRSRSLSSVDKAKLIVDIYKTCVIASDSKSVTEEKVDRALSLLYIP